MSFDDLLEISMLGYVFQYGKTPHLLKVLSSFIKLKFTLNKKAPAK